MDLDINKHAIIPMIVGIKNDRIVHFMLPVSFFIVKHVVPHGKCITEKITTHIAVLYVQPLATSKAFSAKNDSSSRILPPHM